MGKFKDMTIDEDGTLNVVVDAVTIEELHEKNIELELQIGRLINIVTELHERVCKLEEK